jgi:HAD superfamily hydrolase (TIGR01509 family)
MKNGNDAVNGGASLAVIFDLWNTLIAVDPTYDPYPRIQRLLGLNSEAEFRELMRSEWMTRADLDVEGFYELACDRFKRQATPGERQVLCAIWDEYLQNVALLPGVTEVLAELRRRGVVTAIVTNTVQPSLHAVERTGLVERVDTVIGSSNCGFLKPDPRIFQVAMKRLGVEAADCTVVGDKLRTDILGGLILGTRTVLLEPRFGRFQRDGGLPIDAVIPCLADLMEVL